MALPGTDAELLLLHNARCSKCRAALALLEERSVAFEIRNYLEDPLSREELTDLGGRLGLPIREWTRGGESELREAGLGADASDEDLLRALVAHPIAMQRPILVRGSRAVIGRPPERILDLL